MTASAQTQSVTVGQYVRDDDQTDSNRAVVVHRPGVEASMWEIEDIDETVAEYNPDHPPTDEVYLIVFLDELQTVDAWDVSTPESLWPLVQNEDLQYYAYPESRLAPDGTAVEPRQTETGNRYIHRLHITGIGDRLVYGKDYDGTDHQYGYVRDVCFHKGEWGLSEDNHVTIEYEREKRIQPDLPPMLVGIERLEVKEEHASPDFLLDL